MGRQYDMDIAVKGLKEKAHGALVGEAVAQSWNPGYGYVDPVGGDDGPAWVFLAGGEGSLCGGETEEEFADGIAEAVWDALGYYAPVCVVATCLEDLPCESHCREEEEYAEHLKRKEEEDGKNTDR